MIKKLILFSLLFLIFFITTVPQGKAQDKDGLFSFNNVLKRHHPNKKSWVIFIASHAVAWGVCGYVVHNRLKGEDPHSEYPAMAAVSAIDTGAFFYIAPIMGNEGSGYAIYHYSSDLK